VVRPRLAAILRGFEKHQQLIHRHAPAFIRHVLDSFREHTQSAAQAAEQLGLSPSRLYALATAYNLARPRKRQALWTPGASGGDHAAPWPQPVLDLLKKRLACTPPCPYSFAAFLAHGRPLQIYVDYHSIFFTHDPDALTRLGWALKFYDISFRYAPTPQAKGKIERAHQYWQGRLPAYFASEKITDIEMANLQIDALRAHRNAREVHRELRQTPQRAWAQAEKEKRSVLRPAPRCPWWDYVWSVRTVIKVGSDGRGPIGTQRLRLERPPGSRAVLCLHPSGHHSVLVAGPNPTQKPVLLFTNRPK
jgi:hypothetical protein